MKNKSNCRKAMPVILIAGLMLLLNLNSFAQLGIYSFTGSGTCPHQNPAVTAQPANANFSNFTVVNATCNVVTDMYSVNGMNNSSGIDLSQYLSFTVTPDAGYQLSLTSFSFTHIAEQNQSNNLWHLRSSLDNYAADIASASITDNAQTPVVNLPAGFSNIGTISFRIYAEKMQSNKAWTLDDITLNGSVNMIPVVPADPTSNSPQCASTGVTITATGSAPAGITRYWQTSATGTSTANSAASQLVTTSGTYYIRARNDVTLAWSTGAGMVTVTVNADVAAPVFTAGAVSNRCQAAATITYTATAANATTMTYSLDAASIAGGNTINASTGAVTYDAAWSGISVITISADGCAGPKTATHTVTTGLPIGTPVFALGSSSFRCLASGSVTYSATSTNSTNITYSLDAGSLAGGNTINASTGAVSYFILWVGTTTITATATGCGGPKTATHIVTINGAVSTPVFAAGAASTRCQGAGNITYTATASNASGITYSLDASSVSSGNSINAATGEVTYAATWNGTATVTATAAGCNGPKTAAHTITITPTIGTPVFTSGSNSTRCQAAGTVTYAATASNSTARTYSLDAASITGGNTINASTGAVTYTAAWSGTSVITVTAAGCNGPTTATHTVTITPVVGSISFTAGTTSVRCQGAATITYDATATNTSGITYSLNAASISGGNTINASTGAVTYAASWSGSSVITASAPGCSAQTATHTVTINPTVATPVFTAGTSSVRCQAAGTVTYTATAANNTGISYSLDAASLSAGNTINTSNGAVTYLSSWSGSSVVTVTVTGCSGPLTATHTITSNALVGTLTFSAGATSVRCQGAATITYGATAANTTGITYSLNAASISGGNSINASTGAVTYAASWSGSSVITATAAGCTAQTATHTVTITPTVAAPVFSAGSTSVRCQGSAIITYTATAANNTGITYTLDAASITGGNTINSSTGAVTYAAAWTGTSVITVTVTGCSGPKTATHTVTNNTTVGATIFTGGATSVRCQGVGSVAYPATATNSTSVSYSLDAASTAGGNTINSVTGTVAYAAGWSGTTIITATAAGCNGPTSAVHTVTVTPTVGVPVFTLTALSTRCQGNNSVIYTATSTNSTGITYSLDAASITGGNTINTATGAVTYTAAWNGSSVITATSTGCNGPKTATHTVTITPTVAAPVFALGLQSVRTQGAATITYTATASYSTAVTYSLDAASISGGNSINASTGAVNWSAAWFGASVVTATAAGCNGPATSTHIINVNPVTVQSPLYLSTAQILDRIDPVATNITTTLFTADLSSAATTNTSFSLSPALCSDLTIKAQTIGVTIYSSITSGTMPVNPNITATISYNGTTIINLINPVYNSGTGIISWTATLGADVTVPAGQTVDLKITTAQAGVVFKINYHSATKPSRISLFPVSTFIDFMSFDVYNAPYPAGVKRTNGNPNVTYYVRAVITTPFGFKDITGLDLKINPPGTTTGVSCVDSSTCTRTYEYPWTPTGSAATYYMLGTAKEGFENIIKNSELLAFNVCSVCAPVAVNDSATGAGGAPLLINVLGNDYDANNNIKISTLTILGQPNNGTGYISNNKVVYLPNGSFSGKDTLTYQICDSTNLCATGKIFMTINPFLVDPCSEATQTHVYFLPFSENEARMALDSSSSVALASNNIRTVISMKTPYPGQVIIWDEWEDGYEVNPLNPLQATTKVWGDGNPYNGIAPGYPNDVIPAGGSIILDNTIPTNPRVPSALFFDGRDKIISTGQITVTQVSGEPSIIGLQCMKTNVSPTLDYGTSFTVPVGQDFPSQDFKYTSLFIRASKNNTQVEIDKDNNGTLETSATLNEGEVLLVNGGVMTGATITATENIGVELHFGGNDNYSSRDVPIFPATWYSNNYYSPVATTGRTTVTPRDSAVVMLYNSLNRPLTINWTTTATPTSGSITLPAKTVKRVPLAYSQTAAYKFVNPTGESFTAIEVVDSYSPTGSPSPNVGSDFDWAFNLIAENRLTDFATVAWAPGSTDGTRNDNPVWVTPTSNTTIYVKYDGNIGGTSGSISPCGMRYDVSYALNALTFKRLLDPNDNDQSGLAVYTCNGTKLAAVYGEDPSTAVTANPSWDVGSTIQPFCKQKLIFANDDYSRTLTNQPVTIPILLNDFGYLATVDPSSVTNTALLQPKHGTIVINLNGTIVYTPAMNYVGKDTLEYNVCSTPTPIVCDIATVYIDISACPAPSNGNLITGNVFIDKNDDGINNDGGAGLAGGKVYLYVDGNCNQIIDANELKDSVIVDATGSYQFVSYPEKTIADDFDGPNGTSTCAGGSDGNAAWVGPWTDIGDPSTGFCPATAQSVANTDAEIVKDAGFSYALRLKDNNVSATRVANISGASYAFLSFSYRRKSATLAATEDVTVQASTNGTAFSTIYTIAGDGTADADYVDIVNQDISAFTTSNTTYIRFITNNNVDDGDTVYIDNVKIQYLRYPMCYMTRFDSTTIPANYHRTTVLQKNFTATSSQTCLSPYDFGVAKNKVSIAGTLYNDANGMTDNTINGTVMGTITGSTVYAYLTDTSGKVVYRTTLNPANGTYLFPAVDVVSDFTLSLSTLSVNLGDVSPLTTGLAQMAAPVWVNTADSYGNNNVAGIGFKPLPNCSVKVTTGTVNVTNVNFGIERLPDSDDRTVNYTINTPNTKYLITGGLTGTDPEDGTLGTGKIYKITTLPANAVLYYNNVLVTLNQVISNFDATLLKIDPNDNVIQSVFQYASRDAAGLYDPSPATVTVRWLSVLPVTILDFHGVLNGSKTDLSWTTTSEINTSFFDVERSLNSQTYTKIGSSVTAHGSVAGQTTYVLTDPSPVKGTDYYRLKIVDNDGSFSYSNIVTIRINIAENNQNGDLAATVRPNPFTTKIDVSFTLAHDSKVQLMLYDMSGKLITMKEEKGLKGKNQLTFFDLDQLASGTYILRIITDYAKTEQKIMKF